MKKKSENEAIEYTVLENEKKRDNFRTREKENKWMQRFKSQLGSSVCTVYICIFLYIKISTMNSQWIL